MIKAIDHIIELREKEFEIRVCSLLGVKEWSFAVNSTHTIRELKRSLIQYIDAEIEEMSLVIGLDHPYPLRDDMYLEMLHEEHRTLHVMINENPKKVIPRRLLLFNSEENKKNIIDLRNMRDDDFQYLSYNWIVSYNFRGVKKVFLSATHSLFDQTLKEIADEIEGSLNIEERPQYPLHYFIDNVDEKEEGRVSFIQHHFHAFHYFYEKLNHFKNFHRVKLYFSNDENLNHLITMITREWVNDFCPDLAEKMWAY